MAWYRAGGGGIPSSLKTDMNDVLNKKFGTSQDYPPADWAPTVNLMGPLPEKTVSGSIATFPDGADDVPLKKCEVTLPASLDGYSEVDVIHAGKNLWAFGDNTVDTVAYIMLYFTKPLPAGTYTVSCELISTTTTCSFRFRKEDGSYLVQTSFTANAGRVSQTLTLPEPAYRVYLYSSTQAGGEVTTWKNVQIEVGQTMTDYEAYQEPTEYEVEIPNPNPNLFDKIGGTYTIGRWKTDGTVESGVGERAYKIAISEKTDYVIHGEAFCAVAQSRFVVFFDANDNFISYAPFTHTDYTAKVTSPANSAYMGVTWDGLLQSVDDSVKKDFAVYGGSIDVVNGQGESTHANVKVSDLTWTKQTASGRDFFISQVSDMKTGTPKEIASVLPYGGEITVAAMADKSLASWTNSLRIYDTDITTVSELLEAYGNDGISYPLATAEPFNVEPIAIDSKAGTNNIWNEQGDTEVTYRADINLALGGQ